jgi:hypothetical protein
VAVIFSVAGLALAALLVVMPRYHLQKQAMSMAGDAAVKSNMKALQMILEQFMAEDGRGYPVRLLGSRPDDENPMLAGLALQLQRMQNPIDREAPALAQAWRAPPFWELYKPGQVIYVPSGVKEGFADGYIIYGLGPKGPLATVIDRRPEALLTAPPGQ